MTDESKHHITDSQINHYNMAFYIIQRHLEIINFRHSMIVCCIVMQCIGQSIV